MLRKKTFIILLIVIGLLFETTGVARASIVLVVFESFPEISDIYLTWRTSSETNNAGFYIQRSTYETGVYTRLSSLIPTGSLGAGADYNYIDTGVQVNVDYYYKLEAVDTNGVSTFYGPIHGIIILEDVATLTPTPTGQATLTPTKTATVATGVTLTFTPTKTNTSLYSPTPSRTSTQTPVGSMQPTSTYTQITAQETLTGTEAVIASYTATLAPVPPIELLFPEYTPTATDDLSQGPVITPEVTPITVNAAGQPIINAKTILLGSIVTLLWLFLAGFLVIFIRKVSS